MHLLATALLLLAATQESSTLAPLEYLRVHRSADELARKGSWKEAVPLYERLVATYDGDSETWYRLARGQRSLGNDPEAIAAFERVLELGSTGTDRVQLSLAGCNARIGDEEAAFRWIEAALASRLENRSEVRTEPGLKRLTDDERWSAVTGALPPGELSRDEGWRFDLETLVREARRKHAGPTRPAFSTRFEEQARELRASIPDLTNDQIVAGMMRLTAVLDDGHSAIYGPGEDSQLAFERRVLPYKFYLFPEGLYIVDGEGAAVDDCGSRVVRFGKLEAEEVLRRMSRYRGVDNPMTWTWMGPQFQVRQLALLREVGAIDAGDSVELTLVDAGGEERTLTVLGGEHALIRKLRPSPAAFGDVPRYLRSVDANYWMEPLPDHGALYFQFNQVRDAPLVSIAAFAEKLRTALTGDGVTTLIVDVRHNNGGNNTLVRPLVRVAVEFELRAPGNRIFVLTGRNTFSAAQNFINRLERWTDATFVGEPSSSSPNFVGEETNLLLPYSRLRGSLSTLYWQDSDPWDDRSWIAPDLPVQLTAADYFENRDPALEAVLEVIESE